MRPKSYSNNYLIQRPSRNKLKTLRTLQNLHSSSNRVIIPNQTVEHLDLNSKNKVNCAQNDQQMRHMRYLLNINDLFEQNNRIKKQYSVDDLKYRGSTIATKVTNQFCKKPQINKEKIGHKETNQQAQKGYATLRSKFEKLEQKQKKQDVSEFYRYWKEKATEYQQEYFKIQRLNSNLMAENDQLKKQMMGMKTQGKQVRQLQQCRNNSTGSILSSKAYQKQHAYYLIKQRKYQEQIKNLNQKIQYLQNHISNQNRKIQQLSKYRDQSINLRKALNNLDNKFQQLQSIQKSRGSSVQFRSSLVTTSSKDKQIKVTDQQVLGKLRKIGVGKNGNLGQLNLYTLGGAPGKSRYYTEGDRIDEFKQE